MGLDSLFNDRSQLANKINVLNGNVGDVTQLTTTAKDSLVHAVNEHHDQIGNLSKKSDWIDVVRDYGCKGDGVADDTQAFQNALNAASKGAVIKIPLGARILITQPLMIPNSYFTIEQESDFHQTMDGNTYATGLIFKLPPGSTAFAILGQRITLRGVFAQEQGPSNNCTFLSSNSDVHMERCQMYDWNVGVNFSSGSWYTKLMNCEWTNCNIGAIIGDSAYNVQFFMPKFSCTTAIQVGHGCKPISVFGGSMELFTSAGAVILSQDSQISIYGTYFEGLDNNSIGILTASGSNLLLSGCYAYIAKCKRFVNSSGQSNVTINAHGNRYASTTGLSNIPVVYFLPSTGNIDLSGDDFLDVAAGTGTYIGGVSSYSLPGFRIVPPIGSDQPSVEYNGNDLVPMAHAAPPSSPIRYGLYLADGVTWDPLTKAYGHAYLVTWTGVAWAAIS